MPGHPYPQTRLFLAFLAGTPESPRYREGSSYRVTLTKLHARLDASRARTPGSAIRARALALQNPLLMKTLTLVGILLIALGVLTVASEGITGARPS